MLSREIMETNNQEKMFVLWRNLILSNEQVQQWSHGLGRILDESNWAKVFMFFSVIDMRHYVLALLHACTFIRQARNADENFASSP